MRRFNLATLVVVCLSITHAQANLTNPGFETGSLSPWYNAMPEILRKLSCGT